MARLAAMAVLAFAGTAGAAPATLSEAETTALYTAADYIVRGGIAMGCNSGNPLAPASRFAFETADLAGDGSTQVLLIEYNPVCFGREGQAFSVMVRAAEGGWRKAGGATGVAVPVDARNNGWRDIEYGSPKLPRPLLRWNGHDYR